MGYTPPQLPPKDYSYYVQCEYCGTWQKAKLNCEKCGAPLGTPPLPKPSPLTGTPDKVRK